MAAQVFNISLGAIVEKIRDGATLGLLVLKSVEAAATLKDRATVQALLAAAGNTEADFTNYARKTIANGSCVVTVDNALDRVDVDVPDQTYVGAGGATNNTLAKAILYEDTGSDATRVPLTAHDVAITTDGNDVILQIAAAGFFGAS